MTAQQPIPTLRLTDDASGAGVGGENRRAAANAGLDPADPRWVVAARTYAQLQGSTLTPERRGRVLETARRLGLRPFDASVIIALVQDSARTGRPLDLAQLSLVRAPARATDGAAAGRWALALACAAVTALLLARWLVG
ncbi:MAG: hypothetical protein ACYTG1_09990 [Planctomycetota bacterium]|jgi:hypothetical protein